MGNERIESYIAEQTQCKESGAVHVQRQQPEQRAGQKREHCNHSEAVKELRDDWHIQIAR
jgi:hypothetical protein